MTTQDPSKHLDELVNACMVFADRNGKVLDKGSHPFSAWVEMEHVRGDLAITFRAQRSPYSNGSCSVRVHKAGKTVLEASGNYITEAYAMEPTTYEPGDWEKEIPAFKRERRRA